MATTDRRQKMLSSGRSKGVLIRMTKIVQPGGRVDGWAGAGAGWAAQLVG